MINYKKLRFYNRFMVDFTVVGGQIGCPYFTVIFFTVYHIHHPSVINNDQEHNSQPGVCSTYIHCLSFKSFLKDLSTIFTTTLIQPATSLSYFLQISGRPISDNNKYKSCYDTSPFIYNCESLHLSCKLFFIFLAEPVPH